MKERISKKQSGAKAEQAAARTASHVKASRLKAVDKKSLRAIAHELKPVVIVGDKGLSDSVTEEINRALGDHELIKIKLASNDREERALLTETILESTGASKVQAIGKVIVLLKRSPTPKPGLSNLLRHQAAGGR